jgi:cyclic-di-AMP phosphodiesterase PgpH
MASSFTGSNVPRPQGRPLASQDIPWPARLRVLGVWFATCILIIVILVMPLPFSGQVMLQVGDVAPRDITAPRQLTYVSDILTEQRRAMAANSVPESYDSPQARIGRQQLVLAGQILQYVGAVRNDSYADLPAKAAYIRAISGLELPAPIINRILTLPGPPWERVASEVQAVLERAMREEIRENNLADERRKVASRVRLDMADEDAAIVSAIVEQLLVPNSFYNATRTEERRQAARAAVEPATETIERNETILRAGDIADELDIEALRALGLQQRSWSWDDLRAATAFVLLLGVVYLYYLWRVEPQMWFRLSEMLLLASTLVVFTLGAKAMLPARTILPYVFPYAALAIILGIVLNARVGLVTSALFALLVGWLTASSIELMSFALCTSFVGAFKLRRGERFANFAWTALYLFVTNLLVVLAFRVGSGGWDWRGLLELATASLVNAVVTITVTLLGMYLISALFGVTTPLQLLEISRPTHPLLRQLLLKAPGTYHHTLIVSNMAERAAEAIGADALLTRVGAYYHDVGKTIRPYFFVENRTEGPDPHARLDPYTSAQIIITHVKDGVELARKYRLPRRIVEFIPQHQGTLLVSYFYHQAVQQAAAQNGTPDDAAAVDQSLFRYPGPKPQTRETAITMLADGAEATVRSRHPASIEELEQIVGESIQNRLLAGQLDECPLTMADLTGIRRAFVDVLRGLHHPRVAYPTDVAGQRQAPATASAAVPAPAATATAAQAAAAEAAPEPQSSAPASANGDSMKEKGPTSVTTQPGGGQPVF